MQKRFRSITTQESGSKSVISFSFGFDKVKLIAAHDGNGQFAGGIPGDGGAGADGGVGNVADEATEGGGAGGEGVAGNFPGVLDRGGFRAVDARESVGIVGVQRQGDNAAAHLQGADLQLQPVGSAAGR